MDTCVRCGAELGVGRFCLNCGHPIGEPAPAPLAAAPPTTEPGAPAAPPAPTQVRDVPVALPVQAADPTPVPPAAVPVVAKGAAPKPARRTRRSAEPESPTPSRPRTEWDPQEELLPYEEVDDLDGDSPLPGRAWIAWVLGAVLLVGLVFVLLQVFGTDDDGTATDPAAGESSATSPDQSSEDPEEAGSSPTDGPTGVGKLLDLATGAAVAVPDTAPPTTDFDGNLVAYEASQMVDGNPTTTWRMAGDATGQAVTLTLAEPRVVSRVGLVNGYSKQVAGVDWYPNNRRILAVTWGFEDGTTVEQTFAERPGLQRLKVPPVLTGTVTITITSVTPPGSGNLGRDYTAISEVAISGRRAG
ncbi:hypothetical protein [Nocardioides sp.]|uniref:NADase-type glycan-binding domain-containing protein n=1 Tax=Nocardioides sp. TaxID=35761 RepID=UPI00262A501E|nr:hypothetical protein [Nocardioides sp.]